MKKTFEFPYSYLDLDTVIYFALAFILCILIWVNGEPCFQKNSIILQCEQFQKQKEDRLEKER